MEPMSIIQVWLSLDGRISRSTYWLKYFVPVLFVFLVLSARSPYQFQFQLNSALGVLGVLTILVLILFIALVIWGFIAVGVKRYHDLDKSGWWLLISLIPVIGEIWVFIELGFRPGSIGPNRFGAAADLLSENERFGGGSHSKWRKAGIFFVVVAIVVAVGGGLSLIFPDKSDYAKCTEGTGDPDYRIDYCTRVIESSGGLAYADKGDHDQAVRLKLRPDYALAFNNRGLAYADKGDYDRAIQDYDEAIRLKPGFAMAFNNRGAVYDSKGEYDRAIQDYDEAIRLKPGFAMAFNNKAWTLATANVSHVRDEHEAVRLASEAVRLNDNPIFRDTLATAYAEAGQFDNAVMEQQRAIEMLRAAGERDAVPDYQSRLDLYRRRQPYRQSDSR
jgi:uncharacterized membrane protein YhaH (DUF805 family)/Tfp pilus assembly protein PilF